VRDDAAAVVGARGHGVGKLRHMPLRKNEPAGRCG